MDVRTTDYTRRRGEIETYFDRTAAQCGGLTVLAPPRRLHKWANRFC